MSDEKILPGSCDWVPEAARDAAGRPCRIAAQPEKEGSAAYPYAGGYRWQGITEERYKAEAGGWADIARQVLVGARGESAGFDLRYFEIAPGGHSSLEKHRHPHVVIGVRGRGHALLGGRLREVGFLDVLYIAPDDPHQLLNPFAEPFGFFCIVDHDRDRPRALAAEELEELRRGPAGDALRF